MTADRSLHVTAVGRLLLQTQNAPTPTSHSPSSDDLLDLRIIGIFVVLVAGFAGAALPLVAKWFKDASHPATLMLRAASAGVILALAIIHVLPEGMYELGQLHSYPFGPLGVVIGVMIMVWTEDVSRAFLNHTHSHSLPQPSANNARLSRASQTEGQPATEPIVEMDLIPPEASKDEPSASEPTRATGDAHTHTYVAASNAANWAATLESAHALPHLTVRNQVLAYMFELACITHSVLIGVALGVTTDGRQQVMVYIIALVFHQMLEGIGLGSTLVRAGFSSVKGFVMITTYALMTPLGIAIGIGIADAYDARSTTALAVQGSLNSISSGLLLYIGLVQLIAEDFTRVDLQQNPLWVRVGMHCTLAVGVVFMAIVGIWA